MTVGMVLLGVRGRARRAGPGVETLRGWSALRVEQLVGRYVAQHPRRHADHELAGRHVGDHDRAGADERLLADLDTGKKHGRATDPGAPPHGRALLQGVAALGAAHEVVVGRRYAGSDEDVLLERRS